MPRRLIPEDVWETEFEVPIPGDPRRIGPLRVLFQRLLNRTERLRSRIADILGLPWDSMPPDTLAGLAGRVSALEGGSANLSAHRNAPVLDHPDGSVTEAKLANGSVTRIKLADGAVTAEKLAPGASIYDLAIFYPGSPGPGTLIAAIAVPRDLSLQGGSVRVGIAPAADWTATIYHEGAAIGTVFVSRGGGDSAVSLNNTPTSLSAGDLLRIVAPSTADTAIRNISISLRGVV